MMKKNNDSLTHEQVQEYYGKILQSSDDLQTDACCTDEGMPDYLKRILAKIHGEVLSRYYGCGLILPEQLSGMRILDLGCGAGRDIYALSALVGEHGEVVGVDMTQAQLDVAQQYQEYHAKEFGYKESNVKFLKGYIEKLDALNLANDSFDIIISNCVINLSPDKDAVLSECYRLLKPGGEMYFSDVYAEQRVPQILQDNEELYGECISGALYWADFLTLSERIGFIEPRMVKTRYLAIENPKLQTLLGARRFSSTTYRLFKVKGAEPYAEDYGQAVRYKGTLSQQADFFLLDGENTFFTNKITPISGNTFLVLQQSRFVEHFEFYGDFSHHFGAFNAQKSTYDAVNPFADDNDVSEVLQQTTTPKSSCC